MLDNGKMLSEEEISKVSGGTGGYGSIPHIDTYNCVCCEMCINNCSMEAIVVINEYPSITSTCIGCGACINLCPTHAIH